MNSPTEKEKMLAGESYNCLDPLLEAERQQTRERLRRFNLAADPAERRALLAQLVGRLGEGSMVESPFHCSYGRHLQLGDFVYLNAHCVILDNNQVVIGNHVMIGPAAQLYTAVHPLQAQQRIAGWEVALPITIEDNAWLGGGAIILPGVTIGRNSIVGAGAVVTRSVPPNCVVAGNPARLIRRLDNEL